MSILPVNNYLFVCSHSAACSHCCNNRALHWSKGGKKCVSFLTRKVILQNLTTWIWRTSLRQTAMSANDCKLQWLQMTSVMSSNFHFSRKKTVLVSLISAAKSTFPDNFIENKIIQKTSSLGTNDKEVRTHNNNYLYPFIRTQVHTHAHTCNILKFSAFYRTFHFLLFIWLTWILTCRVEKLILNFLLFESDCVKQFRPTTS